MDEIDLLIVVVVDDDVIVVDDDDDDDDDGVAVVVDEYWTLRHLIRLEISQYLSTCAWDHFSFDY